MNAETTSVVLRFGLAISIIALGAFVYWLINQRLLVRASSNVFTLFNKLPDKPVLVYFTTPDCVPCKTVQRPAIDRISKQLGERLQVVEIDATERPDLGEGVGRDERPDHICAGCGRGSPLCQQWRGPR